jgi:dCMP deaminase
MSYRPTVEEYAVGLALIGSTRSEGLVTKVGCAILDCDGRILSVGYNGLPKKKVAAPEWVEQRDEKRKFFIHSEVNALSMIKGGDYPSIIAITHSPCASCAQAILSYPSVQRVLYYEEYGGCSAFKEILDFACIRYEMVQTPYTRMIKTLVDQTCIL